MKVRRARQRLMVLAWATVAWACGARSLNSDGGSSDGSDGAGGDTTATGTTEDSGAGSGSSATPTPSTGTTTTSIPEPIPGTWEGFAHGFYMFVWVDVCDFGEACVEGWEEIGYCDNIYVRVEGTMHVGSPENVDCPWRLEVDEVLEARQCEPTDCDGRCSGPLTCDGRCDPALQDCPTAEEKCAVGARVGMLELHQRECVPLPDAPIAQGDACTVYSATDDGWDDCDIGLHCWAEDPGATEGTCVPFCLPDYPDTCVHDCVWCSDAGAGLCIADCPACDLSHSC